MSDVDFTPIASPVNSNGDCFSLMAERSEVKVVRSMDIHSVERIDFLTDCDIFSVKKSECMDKTLIVHPDPAHVDRKGRVLRRIISAML